jgi:hypothetical protein
MLRGHESLRLTLLLYLELMTVVLQSEEEGMAITHSLLFDEVVRDKASNPLPGRGFQ